MSRGSNVGRTVFAVAAAASVAGLLNSSPPATEVRTAAPAPVRSLPVETGAFTATPASVPMPVEASVATTSTTAVASPTTTAAAPPVTEPPPPGEAVEPAPDVAAETYWADPEYVAEPEADDANDDDDADTDGCTHYANLLTVIDDPELRKAMSTIGCD